MNFIYAKQKIIGAIIMVLIFTASTPTFAARSMQQAVPDGLTKNEWSHIKNQIKQDNSNQRNRGSIYSQDAYIKASNTGNGDFFGYAVALSGDTLVVGAYGEDSNAFSVDGEETNNLISKAGAAFVFVRGQNQTWIKQAYLKAGNSGINDQFGTSVSISGDLIVVGAPFEDSNSVTIDSGQSNNDASNAGAAYVFKRSGSNWSQHAYLKASNAEVNDQFGHSVGIDGTTIIVGARFEDSQATGVNNNNTANNDAVRSGAGYVFALNNNTWSQQAYLKAPNTGAGDFFGHSVDISGDSLIIGAMLEASPSTGVNNNGLIDGTSSAGAAYIYTRSDSTWSTEAYLKASNTGGGDLFGFSVGISQDVAVVGAPREDSNSTGVNGTQSNNTAGSSGAAYVFNRTGSTWVQQAYLKSMDSSGTDYFGASVKVLANTLVVGAYGDKGISDAIDAGAAFVFTRTGSEWSQQAYLRATVSDVQDFMGQSVALSNDLIVVGAFSEDSESTGVNNDDSNNLANESGAVYAFKYTPVYSIGGNAVGLSNGNSVVMNNNGENALTVTENGAFTFSTQVTDLSGFAVTVTTQPSVPNQVCEVTGGNNASNNGSGTVSAANVSSIQVTCTVSKYSIGGQMSGLRSGAVFLDNNNGDLLTVENNGLFVFSELYDDLSDFDISIVTHPTSPVQLCSLSNGVGAVSGMNVTTVVISCNTEPTIIEDIYIAREDVLLLASDADGTDTSSPFDDGVFANDRDIENDVLSVVSPGTYTANGLGGKIEIFSNGRFIYKPPSDASGQASFIYDITDGTHVLTTEMLINVAAINDAPSFAISGNIEESGLTSETSSVFMNLFTTNVVFGPSDESSQRVEQYNVNTISDVDSVINSIDVDISGRLTIDYSLNEGTATVQISLQDNGGTSDGGIDASEAIEFTVTYGQSTYTVGGTVSGLRAGTVTLQNNGTDDLIVGNDGTFTFSTPLEDASTYNITVHTHPSFPTQLCQISDAIGSINEGNITTVNVTCNAAPRVLSDSYEVAEDQVLEANDMDGSATTTSNDNTIFVNDIDLDGDVLTVVNPGTFSINGIGGSLVLQSNGGFSYTPPENGSGMASFNFEVTDGVNVASTGMFINVYEINDAPSFTILGDVDATGLINSDNSTTALSNFAFNVSYGPKDEQKSQAVMEFNTSIVSDSNAILNSVQLSNEGHLQLDFSLNNGVAIVQVSLQDNGGTSDGGVDTSDVLEFTVSNTDMVFGSGFEGGEDFRLFDLIEKINSKNQNQTVHYDFESDTLMLNNHLLQLFDDYGSSHAIQRVLLWVSELLEQAKKGS